MDSYYDDLRYNDEHITQLQLQGHANQYPSPYKQNSGPQSTYSPMIRRDDPTIPLYATLKPKLQHQRQYTSNYITSNSNYVPYSTLHRSTVSNSTNNTPPARRLQNNSNQNNYQVLPPPPPPPPPIKPKRTFEYGPTTNDLHSESGAFLLADNYDSNNELMRNENILSKKHRRHHLHQEGSATSLDEEDLDLNDLKDFEDVTFDNLRRPGQNKMAKPAIKKPIKKHHVLIGENNNTSEQSLLLKSSESSSDNTINNVAMIGNSNNVANANELENSIKHLNDLNSNNTQTTAIDASSNNTDLNTEEIHEKIYEETEI